MMYQGDAEFLHQFLPGVKSILAWFEDHIAEDDLLGSLDWWNFCDGAEDFKVGIPPGADPGGSTLMTLTYLSEFLVPSLSFCQKTSYPS